MVNKKKRKASKIIDMITFIFSFVYIAISTIFIVYMKDNGVSIGKVWELIFIGVIVSSILLIVFISVGFVISARSKDGINQSITIIAIKSLLEVLVLVLGLLVYVKLATIGESQSFIQFGMLHSILMFGCIVANTIVLGCRDYVEPKESK